MISFFVIIVYFQPFSSIFKHIPGVFATSDIPHSFILVYGCNDVYEMDSLWANRRYLNHNTFQAKFTELTLPTELEYSPGCAPSVLIFFINMMLFKSQEPLEGCKEYMYDAQPVLEKILLVIAVICIPVMLLGKPFYIMMGRKKPKHHVTSNGHANQESPLPVPAHEPEEKEEEEEEMSEIFIHQAIHTIEYVLSTVSHTASYLRLWALSLAHARE